jgi:zinc transport system substrate-binding protein
MIVMYRPALLVAAALALAGCGGPATAGESDRLSVVAAFYPLAYAVEQVGGDRVTVASLTKPGGEPHDLELLPRQVVQLREADVVVYLRDFQPVVDAAVTAHASDRAFDVAPSARLLELAAEPGAPADDHGHEEHDGHDHGSVDPHFWLDPTRYADVARAIAAELSAKDPAGTTAYAANAARFTGELASLDAEFSAGLAECSNREFVTGHRAFGYLADRYDLVEESVSGLSPEQEPTARGMAQVVDFVRQRGITTVYAEAQANPALTETLARETGTRVAVLDPIEGITDASAGRDYLEVMRANLAALRSGQDCP